MDIADQAVVVTGGASGLGAAVARRFSRAHARVAVLDQNDALGAEVAAEIGGTFVSADVASGPSVEAALDAASAANGPLRALVACAGVQGARLTVRRSGPHDLETFERMLRVNTIGAFNCARLAAWQMSRASPLEDGERGVIVLVSSIVGEDGPEGSVAYAASKAAVDAMTLPLARDLAPHGIRVVTIAPGSFRTPMLDGFDPRYAATMAEATPFPKRFGEPDELAALVAHVVENRMLNGAVIRLDGAMRMTPAARPA